MKTEQRIVYIAVDDTPFLTSEVCKKYEEDLAKNIKSKLHLVSTNIENKLFQDVGSEEYEYNVYKVSSIQDLELLKLYFKQFGYDYPDQNQKFERDSSNLVSEEMFIFGNSLDNDKIYYYGTVKNYLQDICDKLMGKK